MAKVETQDIASVGTRVSWSAIVAGAVIAMAVSVSLSVLGIALGLTVSDEVGEKGLSIGTAIYALLTIVVSLFLGGYVASRATAGETKGEALIYGVLVWALLFLILPIVVGLGGSLAFGSVLVEANRGPDVQNGVPPSTELLKKAGVEQKEAKQQVRQIDSTSAAWWGFAGIVISLVAAILGAIVGAGPELVFNAIYRRTTVVTRTE